MWHIGLFQCLPWCLGCCCSLTGRVGLLQPCNCCPTIAWWRDFCGDSLNRRRRQPRLMTNLTTISGETHFTPTRDMLNVFGH
jgi:hypothetical protein